MYVKQCRIPLTVEVQMSCEHKSSSEHKIIKDQEHKVEKNNGCCFPVQILLTTNYPVPRCGLLRMLDEYDQSMTARIPSFKTMRFGHPDKQQIYTVTIYNTSPLHIRTPHSPPDIRVASWPYHSGAFSQATPFCLSADASAHHLLSALTARYLVPSARQQVPLLPHTKCSRPRSQEHGRARQVPGVHRVNRCRFVVTSATFLDNNLHCYFSSTLFHQLLILT